MLVMISTIYLASTTGPRNVEIKFTLYPLFWLSIDSADKYLWLLFNKTRIFGAYGPIMLALRVWVGFRASWRGGTFFKKSSFVSISASCSEGHLALCSEGHFWRILFGRTLFEDCVQKDTFQKFKEKDILYKLSPINFKMVIKRNP